jgi:8-oxo-dGTP diphosphatase
MYNFNVRVYGILINDQNQVLLSDEEEYGVRFSKFPGGGLEYGEGLIDALKREFVEECDLQVDVTQHFYTTDFFVKSAFNDSQIISVYYFVDAVSEFNVKCKFVMYDFDSDGDIKQAFRWKDVTELKTADVTFPTDQRVVELLTERWKRL